MLAKHGESKKVPKGKAKSPRKSVYANSAGAAASLAASLCSVHAASCFGKPKTLELPKHPKSLRVSTPNAALLVDFVEKNYQT